MKMTILAVVIATISGVNSANAISTNTQVFLSDAREMGTSNQYVINSWNQLSYNEQQEAFNANPSLKTELDAAAKQAPVTPHLDAPASIDRSSHLDNPHNAYTMTPGITKESNPEGKPTGLVSEPMAHLSNGNVDRSDVAAHLDGQHSGTATPHLDAPTDIDRSSHLDGQHSGTATPHLDAPADIDRSSHLDGQHSQPVHVTATKTPDIDRSSHLDAPANIDRTEAQAADLKLKGQALELSNLQRTASQHPSAMISAPGKDGLNGVDGAAGKNGIDGKDGAAGKDGKNGVTTTITKVQTDTKTQKQVAQNQTDLRHVESIQSTQGEYVQHMNQTVSQNSTLAASNSQRLDSVESRQKSLEQQQSNDREEYRAGIAGAVAISGLHYTETDNSVAIGAGDFKSEQGYALGYRHKFSQNVAATVAASETSNGDAMFSASAAIGW